jgi:acyl carrier protein
MPTYDQALAATITMVKRHAQVPRTVHPADHIMNDLGVDSIGVMELVSDIELHFDVSIPKEMFHSISTVDDVARAIVTLSEEKARGESAAGSGEGAPPQTQETR